MDFSKQIEKADEAVRRRNYDFAVELYQQILEIEPDEGQARAGLRSALRKRHELKGKTSGGFLRGLTGAGPLAMARTLRKAGKNDMAAKALETYLAHAPLDEDGNLLLGQALEGAGHYRSARAVYEFLAEIAPRSSEGLKRAGALSYRLGDHAKALEYYERALAVDPRDQESIKARKDLSAERALARSNSPDVQHSREQIKDKDQARDLELAARMHHSTDELGTQLARLEARYSEHPTPELMVELATVHEKLKDYDSALAMTERALSYRRDSYELTAKVGDLRIKQMRKAIAEAGKGGNELRAGELERELWRHEALDARSRVALRPADPALRMLLGRRLLRLGDHDAAMAELQKALLDPRSVREARVLLAQCFQGKGYLDLAKKEYERALEGAQQLDDRGKEILYNLGVIAEAEGDRAQARSHYSRIFETDVGYRDVAAKMELFK